MLKGKSLKILCVDEDDIILQMERRMLERICPDSKVFLAFNLEDALTITNQQPIDMLFCETNSQRFDILPLLQLEKPIRIKIAFSDVNIPESLRSRFDAFIGKPFSLKDLVTLFDRPDILHKIEELNF
jgi:DNA-binding NtrC family response regulator